jgi:hypothetical protein
VEAMAHGRHTKTVCELKSSRSLPPLKKSACLSKRALYRVR